MYDFRKLVLGVAPTRRDGFRANVALASKQRVMPALKEIFDSIPNLEIVDIEDLNEEGLMYDHNQAAIVAKKFKERGVDALFVPHVNFGNEEAIAKLAKLLKVPTLLWGPRDGSRDGSIEVRGMGDVQCGLFASGRALLRYGIPFTYIENCWLDAPVLKQDIIKFIRAASVAKAFKNCRVLQISARPRQFMSVKINEGELMERFGLEVVPCNLIEYEKMIEDMLANKDAEIKALIAEWNEKVEFVGMTDEQIRNMAAIELAIIALAEKYQCNTVASECWTVYHSKYGVGGCFVFGDLSAKGLSVSCECDIHGTISSLLMNAVTRMESPSFLADITVRHPTNDNAELFWHCGPFPYQLARDKTKKPAVARGNGQYEIEHGIITLCRFDVDKGNYVMFCETGKGVDGPPISGNYVWLEVSDWPAWERKLVCGPYIHHIAGAHGDYKAALIEASKYIGVQADFVDAI